MSGASERTGERLCTYILILDPSITVCGLVGVRRGFGRVARVHRFAIRRRTIARIQLRGGGEGMR